MRIWPGHAQKLGATWDGEGVNFAVFSEHAERVELCLFGGRGGQEQRARIPMGRPHNGIWHCYLPDVRPGQLYGYRLHGPYAPEQGHRFNPYKLLLDPYAKAISGQVPADDALLGHLNDGEDDAMSVTDSAPFVPKSVVVDSAFTWGNDRPPQVPWANTVIYECHVKGMTALHPDVPEELRGTFLGIASDAILDHLVSLSVTAVEFLPVQHAVSEARLLQVGLSNYWGYNTVGFFAPDPRFASGALGQQVYEFKTMVKALHRAGMEVILDVVYNHTAESTHLGPTLCFRGIDNRAYYRLRHDDLRRYDDITGCGNSLSLVHARALQLVLDSLRYWVTEMHVDGFRFDLAPVLARDPDQFDPFSRFFATVQQDPVLSRVKLIAEPWDLGPGGYRLGGFPPGWAEWNGRYRDSVRRFWRGDEAQVPELASRLSGSSDLFHVGHRGPHASVNFITCHDGFTLHDLVTYEQKHNAANRENNRDGVDNNYSRNWGVEGETESAAILDLRTRMKKNLLATLAFSQGVPMLSHGDELGRTQRGNNNAYCHDNELSWLNWELDAASRPLLQFTRKILALRASNPVFRRRAFFDGDPVSDQGVKDVSWLRSDGGEMTLEDWSDPENKALGMLIHGASSDEVDERGRPNRGQTLVLLMNSGGERRHFVLPSIGNSGTWHGLLDTGRPTPRPPKKNQVLLLPHALMLLEHDEGT